MNAAASLPNLDQMPADSDPDYNVTLTQDMFSADMRMVRLGYVSRIHIALPEIYKKNICSPRTWPKLVSPSLHPTSTMLIMEVERGYRLDVSQSFDLLSKTYCE